jgi:hypothetical protein
MWSYLTFERGSRLITGSSELATIEPSDASKRQAA